MSAPANGGTAAQASTVTIAGTAVSPNGAVTFIRIYVNGVLFLQIAGAASWTTNVTNLPVGVLALQVSAVDAIYGEGPLSTARTFTITSTSVPGLGGWTPGVGITPAGMVLVTLAPSYSGTHAAEFDATGAGGSSGSLSPSLGSWNVINASTGAPISGKLTAVAATAVNGGSVARYTNDNAVTQLVNLSGTVVAPNTSYTVSASVRTQSGGAAPTFSVSCNLYTSGSGYVSTHGGADVVVGASYTRAINTFTTEANVGLMTIYLIIAPGPATEVYDIDLVVARTDSSAVTAPGAANVVTGNLLSYVNQDFATTEVTSGGSPTSSVYDIIPVTAGGVYNAQVYLYAVDVGRTCALSIDWLSSSNAVISTSTGTGVAVGLAAWTALQVLAATAPTGAVNGRLTVTISNPALNDTFRLDYCYLGLSAVPSTVTGEGTFITGSVMPNLWDQEFYGPPPVGPPPPPSGTRVWQTVWESGGHLTDVDWPVNITGGITSGARAISSNDTFNAYIYDEVADKWKLLIDAIGFPAIATPEAGWNVGVYAARQAPSNPAIIYAILSGKCLKSTDGSVSWTQMPAIGTTSNFDPSTYLSGRTNGPKLIVDPRDPNHVLLASPDEGLWRTTDGATSWVKVASVPNGVQTPFTAGQASYAINGLGFDRLSAASGARTSVVHVHVNGSGTYRSTDGGATFAVISGSPTSGCNRAYFGPSATNSAVSDYYLVLAQASQVWRWRAGAYTQLPTDGRSYESIAVHPTTAGLIIISDGGGGLMKSADGGATFPNGYLDRNDPTKKTLNGGANEPQWMISGTDEVFFSTASIQFKPGTNTIWCAQGIGMWSADASAINGSAPGSVVAWFAHSQGINMFVTNRLRPLPAASATKRLVMAAWDRNFAYSTLVPGQYPAQHYPNLWGGGAPFFGSAWDFAVDPLNWQNQVANLADHRFLESLAQCGPCYSNDGGTTWNQITNFPNGFTSATQMMAGSIARSGNTIVWAPALYAQPWRTLDFGATWQVCTLPGLTNAAGGYYNIGGTFYSRARHILCADPTVAGKFYITGSDSTNASGCWVSTDNAATWTRVFNGEIASSSTFNATLDAVPGQSGHLHFTSGQLNGAPIVPFMRSTNGGSTWTAIPNVLEVWAFGYGQPFSAGSYPALIIAGYVGGVWGLWISGDANLATPSWTKIADYIPGAPGDWITSCCGVFGTGREGEAVFGTRGTGAWWTRVIP
jgi:hypothetical protein